VPSVPITLGEAIRRARKQSGYTQERVADYLGVSKSTVGSWENGIAEPSFLDMVKFVELTDAKWLLETDFA
jgi:transcriptional regulator with XRE-family HTH domain